MEWEAKSPEQHFWLRLWVMMIDDVINRVGVSVNTIACAAPPTIQDGDAEVAATAGSRVALTCRADGLPKPRITWLKDGAELSANGARTLQRGGGSLQLTRVNVSDGGLYECIATNEAGTAQRRIVLTVQGTAL